MEYTIGCRSAQMQHLKLLTVTRLIAAAQGEVGRGVCDAAELAWDWRPAFEQSHHRYWLCRADFRFEVPDFSF